jgi:hypothetical protein
MSDWTEVWRDTHKRIERRPTGAVDEFGGVVFEERTTYTDPLSDEALLAAYMDEQRAGA